MNTIRLYKVNTVDEGEEFEEKRANEMEKEREKVADRFWQSIITM